MHPLNHRNSGSTASVRVTASGLVVAGDAFPVRMLAFVDSVFRGIGQVMLQDNSFTGFLFLVGIFCNSVLCGCGALLGAATATAVAMYLGVARPAVRAGLYGFNGALVAIALLYFLEPGALAWAYVVLAAACTTVVMAALTPLLGIWKIPALTAPFVITTLLFILACARFGRLHSTDVLPVAGLPQAAVVEGVVGAATVVEGIFKGVAQVFFQDNIVTGLFFVAGLLVASRVACLAALLGSLGGLLVAWALGAGEPAIRAGAFGFNSVLVAIALGSGVYVADRISIAYAGFAVVVSAVIFAGLSAALEPIGMPALTAPFVLVVWLFLFASPLFARLRSKPSAG